MKVYLTHSHGLKPMGFSDTGEQRGANPVLQVLSLSTTPCRVGRIQTTRTGFLSLGFLESETWILPLANQFTS